MSSSSSNKQPLLIDRPLHEWVTLGSESCLVKPDNFYALAPGGFKLLVDCTANDGALIDSISIMAPEAGLTEASVLIFLSTTSAAVQITPDNTASVANMKIGSQAIGERTVIPLPPLIAPVPNVGDEPKNTGLFVPKGRALFAGLSESLQAPSLSSRVQVFAQGGFY